MKKLLEITFKKTLKQCDGFTDDRLLFINCYNSIKRAIEEFEEIEEKIKSPILRIGMKEKINEQEEELKQLESHLKERNMIK